MQAEKRVRDNRNKVKTVVIVYDYAFINGGAAQVAISSAIGLSKVINKVIYFAACGPVCDILKNSNVDVHCLDIYDINTDPNRIRAAIVGIWNPRVKREFNNLLNKLNPRETVIHIHGWTKALTSVIFKVAKQQKFKVIVTLHEYFVICPNGGLFNYKRQSICKYKPLSIDCILCNCDKRNYIQKVWRLLRQLIQNRWVMLNKEIHYIYISNLNYELIKPYVKSTKFTKILNPVNLGEKTNDDIEQRNVFLFIGRLSDEKGAELFCQAVKELQNERKL